MSNSRKLMPPLRERPNPPVEPPKLMTAIMSSGELPPEGTDYAAFWDRVLARVEDEPIKVTGQPKAGRSWLTSTTSPDK